MRGGVHCHTSTVRSSVASTPITALSSCSCTATSHSPSRHALSTCARSSARASAAHVHAVRLASSVSIDGGGLERGTSVFYGRRGAPPVQICNEA